MKTISFAVVFLLFSGLVFAQKNSSPTTEHKALSAISPASNSFDFSNGSISWTLGETLVTLKVGDSDAATPEIFELDFDIVAYPNPTNDKVTISHNSKTDEKLTFTIYDFSGRELIRKQLIEQENEINMQYLPPALYLVKITDSKNHSVKSFKIIKH
ncbi:MAG: T9SS type A sorting domain-containing protein [Maribacter sp.]|uniref:T9SS type A sorting domain-containing protein n=1 Tax=Maribacter sp. TaxID=1897614 RepID=UPI003C70B4F9